MPIYDYHCSLCNADCEISQSIKEYKPLKKCPACKKNGLERVIGPVMGFVKDVKTVGQQAEANAKKVGKTKTQEIEGKRKETHIQKEKPWWKSDHDPMKIANLNEQQKQRYIMEGKII